MTTAAIGIRDAREYIVNMRDQSGGDDETTVYVAAGTESDQDAEAMRMAVVHVEDWVRGGDYGSEGASVVAYYTLEDADSNYTLEDADSKWSSEGASVVAYYTLEDADSKWSEVRIEVEIEAAHESLIRDAMGDDGCGNNPDDHSWSSEDESGLTENPGVWSVGGTAMVLSTHCETCGLRRIEKSTGSQRNTGEHDTVEYLAPESDA